MNTPVPYLSHADSDDTRHDRAGATHAICGPRERRRRATAYDRAVSAPLAAETPRMTVAFAMFCKTYDPERPTDLRTMITGIGGWTEADPPTLDLTLALGLWNAGGAGMVRLRLGVRRPERETEFVGEGDTTVRETGEMVILPLKVSLTFDQPGIYWAVCEFDGRLLIEVPFSVTETASPAVPAGLSIS